MTDNDESGFFSRKPGFFSGWRKEWWILDNDPAHTSSFKAFPSAENREKVLYEVHPNQVYKVTTKGSDLIVISWNDGGSLQLKISDPERLSIWVRKLEAFVVDGKATTEKGSKRNQFSQVYREASQGKPRGGGETPTAAAAVAVASPVEPSESVFSPRVNAGKEFPKDESEVPVPVSPILTSPHKSLGNSGLLHLSIKNRGGSYENLSKSFRENPPRLDTSAAATSSASSSPLNSPLPRLGSSRDILDNQLFMGKARSFVQKTGTKVDESEKRKGVHSSRLAATPLQHLHHQVALLKPSFEPEEKVDPKLFEKSPLQREFLLPVVTMELFALLNTEVQKLTSPALFVDLFYSAVIPPESTLVTQGSALDKLFIIESGRVGVYSIDFADKPGGELEHVKKKGDVFFPMALLFNQPGPFTVTSHTECRLWILSRKKFEDFMTLQHKKLVTKKIKLLEGVPLIAENLSFDTIVQLADCMEFQEFPSGTVLLQEGEVLKKLFILDEGEVTLKNGSDELQCAEKGEVFGEWALLSQVKSKVSIVASSSFPLVMLVLDVEEMEELIGPLKQFLLSSPSSTKPDAIKEEEEWTSSDHTSIFEFSFSANGTATAEEQKLVRLATMAALNRFTRHALKREDQDQVPVRKTQMIRRPTANVKTLKISSVNESEELDRFTAYIPGQEDDDQNDDDEQLNMDIPFEHKLPQRPELNFNELTLNRKLGQGQFGSVYLCSFKEERVAVKAMGSHFLVDNGWEIMIENERDAMLELAGHPFLIGLLNYFSTKKHVFLVLEACETGNLADLLNAQPEVCFQNEELAKFYLSNIVLALEFMHSKEMIYRDLKSENVMVAANGYCKLADFGLTKKTSQTYTFCGTPDFMAPEILLRKGHGSPVDWWACGVLLFEMLAGETPFYMYETQEIYERILDHRDPKALSFPAKCSSLSENVKHLIQSFLHPKPSKRLGVKFPGVLGIKKHPFFKRFDWDAIQAQKMLPPLMPKSTSLIEGQEGDFNSKQRKLLDAEKEDKSGWSLKFGKV